VAKVEKSRKQGKTPPSWPKLLDDIVAKNTRVVLETESGARVILMPEKDFLRLGRPATAADPAGTDRLTQRELGILALAADGVSGARIASQLGLAPNTVAQHLVSVRRKLSVSTTAAAVEVTRASALL
jgi:DNA-binding CsgD family transcriptional regulator